MMEYYVQHKIKDLMVPPDMAAIERMGKQNKEARIANMINSRIDAAIITFKRSLMKEICEILKEEV